MTLLFTDIEGSTRLLDQLGDDYGAMLADHRRLLRAVWARHEGVEVGTDGDSFFVAFADAESAVEAAIAAQRTLAEHPWPSDAGAGGSGSAWGCTPASRTSTRVTTGAPTSTTRRGSAPPPTADRSWPARPRGRWT